MKLSIRKLKLIEHISLDGVIEAGSDFPYGDWTAPYRTPACLEKVLAMYGETFDVVLGRRTISGRVSGRRHQRVIRWRSA